ncbi:MAG TPA: type II secretion system F family protein [Acetobacteraceae bacterium]|jgi:general secretion pathway protein F|nr:type II secretion system F family protein [Acetobacteraceae bacterium]
MPAFRYRAIGPTGDIQTGVTDAATQADVVAWLQRQGSIPMRAEPAGQDSWFAGLWHAEFSFGGGLRRGEVATIMRELSMMLTAGQDLDRALRFLDETAPNARVRTIVAGLRDSVRDGKPLALALSNYPRAFSRLQIALVRAGEASGRLADALAHLADLLERQQRLASSVTSALIYPALLVVAAVSAVTLLLTRVVPEFVPLFQQSGATLPESTQFLISAGAFVSQYGALCLLALLLLIVLLRAVLRAPQPRLATDRLLLRLPLVGTLLREIQAARFTRMLGTLLSNGVPLIAALGIVREAVANLAVLAALDRAAASARAGAGLAAPLQEARVFPLRTTHLLLLGEENAELGPMSLRAADVHEERTRVVLERLVALLVPAITIVMGLVVAGIVTSLLTAMLSLNNLAGG